MTATFIYKNLLSLVYYESSGKMVAWERESQEQRRFTPGGDTSPESFVSSSFFHGRLIQPSPPCTSAQNGINAHCCLTALPTDHQFIRVEIFRQYIFFGHLYTLSSSVSPMQFIWHFCCLLFTLWHSCISCFKIQKLTG